MKQYLRVLMTASLFSLCFAEEQKTPVDKGKISEAFGHFIGRNLLSDAYSFDVDKVIEGIRSGASGKPAPMSDEEYQTALANLQEEAMKKMAEQNLQKAEEFLTNLDKDKSVQMLVPKKLYYKIIQKGNGEAINISSIPLMNFEGKLVDGSVFGSSKDAGGPVEIPLANTVEGFAKGLDGMKEGEKRIVYIHPDLGYGKEGALPPNSLLIFEVEIIKANAPQSDLEYEDDFQEERS